jgi:hypothetical protein
MRLEFLLINYQFIYTFSVYNFSYVLIFFFTKFIRKFRKQWLQILLAHLLNYS